MTELTDEQARARIEAMTMKEREELIAACERLWAGTPLEWRAKLLRSMLDEAKMSLN
jgi:hypothetical protein